MTTPGRLPADCVGWSAFFAPYADIVLVANSDAVDIGALRRGFGQATLFVFFNKVYKVLDAPFDRPSILVARSSEAGANIVYRREVDDVVKLLREPGFLGLMNLRAAPRETLSPAEAFAGRPVGFLDLSAEFAGFYSESHVPSSGFALAVWLAERRSSARIHLAGFTARRSERWKVFHVHDWTFEQAVQRLLARTGRLHVIPDDVAPDPFRAIAGRFPDIPPAEVALVAAEILSERLEHANIAIDQLVSLTKWQRALGRALRGFKPKTRKEKLAEAAAGEARAGADGSHRT